VTIHVHLHDNFIMSSKFSQYIIRASREIKNCIDYNIFVTAGEESNYSCLLPWQIKQVSSALLEEFKEFKNSRIIDANAHIGCDTVNFLKIFPLAHITAIEINPIAFKCLTANIASLSEDMQKRTCLRLGDAINIIPTLISHDHDRGHVVYFDPPWGGPDYKKHKKLHLYLGKKNIIDYIVELLSFPDKKCSMVIFKAPYNFDQEYLKTAMALSNYKIRIYSIKKTSGALDFYLFFVMH
jgi:hypothetical protein